MYRNGDNAAISYHGKMTYTCTCTSGCSNLPFLPKTRQRLKVHVLVYLLTYHSCPKQDKD